MCGTNGCASSGASWGYVLGPPSPVAYQSCRGRHCAHDLYCFGMNASSTSAVINWRSE